MIRLFRSTLAVLVLFLSGPAVADVLICDADFDGDVDKTDIGIIFAANNVPSTGPDDPRDADGDGFITVLDGRACTFQCTNEFCIGNPINAAPVADAGDDQTVDVGETVTLDGTGSSDADGDPLTYAWGIVVAPAGSAASLSDATAAMPTFVADVAGDYVIELIVNDGTESSAPDDVVVVTVPGNTPPVADAGPNQSVLLGDTVTLDGSGSSDVDGDPLTYAWNVVALPAGSAASLSDPTAVMPTFDVDVPGTYVFELVVDDGMAGSLPDSVTITTDNTQPVADAGPDQTVGLSENVQLDGSGSFDADGDPLSYDWSLTSAPAGSAASLDNDTIVNPSFTADVAGTYVGQLIVNDGTIDSAPDTVVIDTSNTQPVADAGPDQTVQVGDTVNLDGSGSSDADGDGLTFAWSFTSIPLGSSASLTNGNSQNASFDADVEGLFVVQLIVNDGTVDSDPDTTTITVEVQPNTEPDAQDDAATTDEDTPVSISVLANDSDADGDPIQIDSVGTAANGNAVINGNQIDYTPDLNYNGSDSFTYTITDGEDTASATVTVTINPVNDDPDAVDDSDSTDEDVAVVVSVLGNDSDVDGDTLTVTGVSDPANGGATTDGTTVTYTPDDNFSGIDTFTYDISDGNGGTDTATVTIDVGNTNDDPVAEDDTATTDEDVDIDINVLANDSDPDGDTLTVDSVTQGSNGTVVNNGTNVTYTPDLNFNGSDSFTYIADDGNGGQDVGTVNVTVDPVNDDPEANDDNEATDESTLVSVNVLGNDSDVDGDTLSIDSVTDPANGTAVINGSFVDYTPDDGFDGDDTFNYTISDGNGGTDSATVTVSVADVNEPPVANAGPDQSVLTTDLVQLDGSASDDPDGDALTYAWSVVSGPAGSTVSFSDPASATPTATFSSVGAYVLQLSVTAAGQSDTDTVAIQINQAPSIAISNTSVSEGDAGTTTASVTVSLSAAVNRIVTVQFATADGTASLVDNDYQANSGTISFPAGSTAAQIIDVVINGDSNIESNETVFVNLTNAVNATVSDPQGQVTIVNDDAAANMTLTPTSLSLNTFSSGNLTLNLNTNAGVGGVLVTLASSDSGIVSVPASVTVPEGNSNVQVPVTSAAVVGGATITASASGFSDAQSTINVDARGLSIAIDEPLVGVGRSVNGTVTLSQVAPTGGVTINLASDDTGVATVSPPTVNIPEGDTTANFSVDGVAVGIAQISAAATGFATDNVAATVTNNLINLGLLNAIAPGQSSGIALSITNPAPPGGLTVNFVSSDPSIATVTPSITIAAGQQLPVTNPQVTGVDVGSITVTATAAGFAPDTRDVDVTIEFDFDPVNFTVVETNTKDIALNLSAPAPAGGLDVPLVMADPSIATVPAIVTVPGGQTALLVPVTGVVPGDTELTTNLPGTTAGLANIEVTTAPPINVTNNTNLGDDLQAAIGGSLGQPAPAGGVSLTYTSPDPSRLLFALDTTSAGAASVVRTVNAGTSGIPAVYVHALDDSGSIEYTVSAPGYATDTNTVTFFPSGVDINSPSVINTTSFSPNSALQICAWRLTSGTNIRVQNQSIRGGISVDIPVDSSDTDVGVMTVDPVTMNAGQNCISGASSTAFDPVGAGESTVSITQPTGFDVPSDRQSILATVTAPSVQLATTSNVGEDLQTSFFASLQSAPPSPVDVTLTVADPTRAVISNGAGVVGGSSVTFVGVSGTSIGAVYVQGLAGGTTEIVGSAPGYTDDTTTVFVDPSGFDINSPGNFSSQTFASNRNIQLCVWRLNSSSLVRAQNQQIRAGLTVAVPIASSDTNVGVMTSPTVEFQAGVGCVSNGSQFDPINAGTTDVSITQPSNFDTPQGSSPRQTITATVTAPNVNVPSSLTVGDDLQTSMFISLQNAPPVPTDVVVTIDDPSVAVVSTSNTIAGSNTITFPGVTSTSVGTVWVQGISEGSATVTTTAQGFNNGVTTIPVVPSGFDINSPGNFTTQTFANNRPIQICAWRLNPANNVRVQNQQVRPGITVEVPISSSDTNVGVMTVSPVPFPAGTGCSNSVTFFDPISNGTADISITQPAGFDTPGGTPRQQITATVVAPTVNVANSVIVGSDLQSRVTISLQNAPPNPVDVTITSTSAAITTLSEDAFTAGGQSVTFNNVTTTSVGSVYVQGRAVGSAQLTGQAAGFSDSTTSVEVQPSGFDINSPGNFTVGAGAANRNIQICAWRLDPTFLNRQQNQAVRGGLNVSVPVVSSNTSVGTITTSPVAFGPNNGCLSTQFDPASEGTSVISITSPGGFETPSQRQSINATVTP